jgi:hypothetical protein
VDGTEALDGAFLAYVFSQELWLGA